MTKERCKLQLEESIQIKIQQGDIEQFRRLDQFLASKMQLSRMAIKHLFNAREITSRSPLKLNKMPPVKSTIWIHLPLPIPHHLVAENIPLDILDEDDDLIFLNKAAGMVVHPAPGHNTGTLLNALLHHYPDLKGVGRRPGIVHRLDKGTSGVMVVAKTQKAYEKLVGLFAIHDIERVYMALAQVGEEIPIAGTVAGLIARHPQNRLKMSSRVRQGKSAITHYRIVKQYSTFQLLELKLKTGRTHQIRVHLSEQLKIPILCDPLYANPQQQRQNLGEQERKLLIQYEYPLLHAQKLGFIHPFTQRYTEFQVLPPAPFKDMLAT